MTSIAKSGVMILITRNEIISPKKVVNRRVRMTKTIVPSGRSDDNKRCRCGDCRVDGRKWIKAPVLLHLVRRVLVRRSFTDQTLRIKIYGNLIISSNLSNIYKVFNDFRSINTLERLKGGWGGGV